MSLKKQFSKTKDTCKVNFSLPEQAVTDGKKVTLVGDFNSWDQLLGIPMNLKGGQYVASVDLPVGIEFQFRYLIDDHIWENDWAADKYVKTPFGIENSVVSTVKNETVKQKRGAK